MEIIKKGVITQTKFRILSSYASIRMTVRELSEDRSKLLDTEYHLDRLFGIKELEHSNAPQVYLIANVFPHIHRLCSVFCPVGMYEHVLQSLNQDRDKFWLWNNYLESIVSDTMVDFALDSYNKIQSIVLPSARVGLNSKFEILDLQTFLHPPPPPDVPLELAVKAKIQTTEKKVKSNGKRRKPTSK